jgi:hypothetical protein
MGAPCAMGFFLSAPFPWRTKPARHGKSSMAHPYRGPGRLQSSRSALPHGYELTMRAEEQRKASYTLTVRVSDRFPFSPGGCYEIISKFDLGAVSLPGGQIARLTAGRPRLAAAQALGAAPGRPGREDRGTGCGKTTDQASSPLSDTHARTRQFCF